MRNGCGSDDFDELLDHRARLFGEEARDEDELSTDSIEHVGIQMGQQSTCHDRFDKLRGEGTGRQGLVLGHEAVEAAHVYVLEKELIETQAAGHLGNPRNSIRLDHLEATELTRLDEIAVAPRCHERAGRGDCGETRHAEPNVGTDVVSEGQDRRTGPHAPVRVHRDTCERMGGKAVQARVTDHRRLDLECALASGDAPAAGVDEELHKIEAPRVRVRFGCAEEGFDEALDASSFNV